MLTSLLNCCFAGSYESISRLMVAILSLSCSFNTIIFCISINSSLNENSGMRKGRRSREKTRKGRERRKRNVPSYQKSGGNVSLVQLVPDLVKSHVNFVQTFPILGVPLAAFLQIFLLQFYILEDAHLFLLVLSHAVYRLCDSERRKIATTIMRARSTSYRIERIGWWGYTQVLDSQLLQFAIPFIHSILVPDIGDRERLEVHRGHSRS